MGNSLELGIPEAMAEENEQADEKAFERKGWRSYPVPRKMPPAMRLVIERGRIVPFEELPPWSLALDGYVQGPAFDNVRHRYSFDHHKGCIRLITTATCEQVRDAVLLGLDPELFTTYINDVDTDTALGVWVLRNPSRLKEPEVDRLINAAGLLDAHGGAYPLVASRARIEWLGLPETKSRMEGRYEQLSIEELHALLDSIGERFEALLDGRAPSDDELRSSAKVPSFRVLREGTGWVMVEATDPHVLFHLYEKGATRIVTHRLQSDGSSAYTVARRSDFVEAFEVPEILAALSVREPGWGGGSTIGGAPRNADGSRSRLTPDEVFEIVERYVRDSRRRAEHERKLAERTQSAAGAQPGAQQMPRTK